MAGGVAKNTAQMRGAQDRRKHAVQVSVSQPWSAVSSPAIGTPFNMSMNGVQWTW